ncbi:uncharacterized protein [Musca autumnalis]|uniref:uncharacterized protein n=1 Tax=Musca autumnalis TaxID=221902 RepID=UPI003CF384C7
MSAGTRSKSRKRDRPTVFDINRSIIIDNKKKRDDTNQEMEESEGSNPTNDGQIRDLSRTINVNSPISNSLGPVFLQGLAGGPQSANNAAGKGPQNQDVGDRLIEDKIKDLKDEMDEIKRSLIELTKAVTEGNNRAGNERKSGGENRPVGNGTPIEQPVGNNGNSTSLIPLAPQTPLQGNIRGTETHNRDPNSEVPTSSNALAVPAIPQNNPVGPQSLNRNHQSQTNANINRQAPFDPKTSVRINKFGLKFDGSSTGLGVEEFVYRLEYFKKQYDIPWSEVIRDFPLLLSGRAESWYWLFQKTNKHHDWEHLKFSLLNQYQSSKSNFEIVTELVQRKQQPNETIDNFFHTMGQIRTKLVQPISDYDMIKILKRNIRENISRIVYPIPVSSVEHLRIECNEGEKIFLRRENRAVLPPNRPIRQVNEVNVDFHECPYDNYRMGNDIGEVDAIQMGRKPNANITCWNCNKPGHVFRDCDAAERALFCYKCGNPGTKTPKCSICQSGNRSRGVENKGGPRPAENP